MAKTGFSKIWLKAFYWQSVNTVHQISKPHLPYFWSLFLLNAGMCQCTGRRPVRHWCSTADRQEGGRRRGGTPTLAAAAEYNGRRCWAPDLSVNWPRCNQSNDSFAHYNSRREWLSSVLVNKCIKIQCDTWSWSWSCIGEICDSDIERIVRWEPW